MKSLRLRGVFGIYPVVAGCVILFATLAFSMLWFQQKIVDAAVETHGVITPQSQAQMRAVRNLDLLRYYGSLALKSADPLMRRTAILHATLSASHPSTQVDQATRLLMDEAISHIQAIRTSECTPEQWVKMDARLAERADTLVIATSDRVLQQAGSIKGLATNVRNMALAQSILFVVSIAFVVFWGVALQSRARAKNQYFNELSHDLRQRVHAMELFFAREVHELKADSLRNDDGRIHVMVKDLQRYLDNFLDVARMDAVVVKPTLSRFSLVGIFQQLV